MAGRNVTAVDGRIHLERLAVGLQGRLPVLLRRVRQPRPPPGKARPTSRQVRVITNPRAWTVKVIPDSALQAGITSIPNSAADQVVVVAGENLPLSSNCKKG